ncbi:MAG TPA: nucleotide disphospho-sugar-binding domain-containing protein [Thermoanaerobaculia bacterium]|jgi:UDP:flavonoid glycosyltransferase YjiC (YdhE family)|nr:nucleotide disphospho-sugar-binding domain-containing protein [Thermoanaerobaculia bacterium]
MKFLFCSLDSPGFLYPLIGIAEVLKSRGHEVAFVTNLQHEALLAEVGLRRLPRGISDGASFQVAQWGKPLSIALQVKHIEYALDLFPADILVGQSLTYGPLLVAARRDLPVGLLGFCTYLWPADAAEAEGCQPSEVSILSSVEEWRAWRYRGMLQTLNDARALFRPDSFLNSLQAPLLGDLFLLQSVNELEPQKHLHERVHLVGSCLWEPTACDPELEEWMEETIRLGSALIYVQHGRSFHIPNFWHGLVDALAGGDYRVAASTGRLDGEIGSLPENFFVRPHLPQGKILPMARVVVASANTTAVLGALTAGIPALLIPAGGEQPDVAALCRTVGVAQTLTPEEGTPERIHACIKSLLADPGFQERSRYYAAAFARLNGCERAADLLTTLARNRSPMLRRQRVTALMEQIA